jgi:hypothetical protein
MGGRGGAGETAGGGGLGAAEAGAAQPGLERARAAERWRRGQRGGEEGGGCGRRAGRGGGGWERREGKNNLALYHVRNPNP